MGCKAPRQRRHFWQSRQCGFCNLQILKEPTEFESRPLRQLQVISSQQLAGCQWLGCTCFVTGAATWVGLPPGREGTKLQESATGASGYAVDAAIALRGHVAPSDLAALQRLYDAGHPDVTLTLTHVVDAADSRLRTDAMALFDRVCGTSSSDLGSTTSRSQRFRSPRPLNR